MGLALSAWLVVAGLSCYGVWDCVRSLKRPPVTSWRPRIAVIVPVRGVPPNFTALWQAIREQTFPASRVIFALEDEGDPAFAAIDTLPPGPRRERVIAGPASGRGQKVHNLLAALGALGREDEVIVFADADIVPDDAWLLRLVAPLNEPGIKLVSGYRWMTPVDARWSSAFACVANASAATLPRSPAWNLPWGGSIALRRETLDAMNLPAVWDRSLLDDLPLGLAARAKGFPITCPQSLLVPSPTAMGWRDAIAFGRRQYLFVRWHSPKHWVLAAAGTTLPLLGWAVALPLAFTGNGFAILTIVLANLFDQMRASLRQRVPRELWDTGMSRRMALLDRFGTPAVLALHAAVIWSTLLGRSMTWAGRRYSIDAERRIIRIDRV